MPFRCEPDDDVGRFHSVWLGPEQFTLPWHARYLAYGVFVVICPLVFTVRILLSDLSPIPVVEIAVSVVLTTLIMRFVDHDRPLSAVLTTVVAPDRRLPQRGTKTHTIRPRTKRLRITGDPL